MFLRPLSVWMPFRFVGCFVHGCAAADVLITWNASGFVNVEMYRIFVVLNFN